MPQATHRQSSCSILIAAAPRPCSARVQLEMMSARQMSAQRGLKRRAPPSSPFGGMATRSTPAGASRKRPARRLPIMLSRESCFLRFALSLRVNRCYATTTPESVKLFDFECATTTDSLVCAGANAHGAPADVCTVDQCAARAQAQGASFFTLRRDGDANYAGRCFTAGTCSQPSTNSAFS